MKKLFLLFFFVFIYGNTIVGEGIANTEVEAKKEALADLSGNISTNVKSEFRKYVAKLGDEFRQNRENIIKTSSSLPIKGVKIKKYDGVRVVKIEALLDSNSLKIYLLELNRLKKEIEKLKDKNSYDELNELLKNIENFNKNRVVAVALGAKKVPTIEITKSQVLSKIRQFEKKAPNIEIASKILSKHFNKKNIYITPLKVKLSNEVTQFAKLLKDNLSKYLITTQTPQKASYFLRGDYEVLKDSIFIKYNLYDKSNNILKTATLLLEKPKNINYTPKTISFDESLKTGYIKSGKLNVHIGFRGYYREDGIDLKMGDRVDIVLKSNKEICYFLVGHTLKDKKFSYLIYLNDTSAINYLTGEDVNRNIIIAQDVEIDRPLGNERLEVFASTLKKNRCPLTPPKCEWRGDFCVIDGNPKKVVANTRALNFKHKKIEKAEDSISWTSFE